MRSRKDERVLRSILRRGFPRREDVRHGGCLRGIRYGVAHRGRGGFSLLELVLTLAILASVTLSVTLLLVPLARQSRISRETEAANLAARRVLERIQATPFKDILPVFPQSSEQPIAELPSGKVTLTYDDPAADPLVVKIDVTWQSPELGAMARAFHTMRTE